MLPAVTTREISFIKIKICLGSFEDYEEDEFERKKYLRGKF
jgi:hypothetical protein